MLHAVHHGNNNRALCEAMLNMLYGVIGAPALGGYQQMLNLSGVLHRLAVKEMRRRGRFGCQCKLPMALRNIAAEQLYVCAACVEAMCKETANTTDAENVPAITHVR